MCVCVCLFLKNSIQSLATVECPTVRARHSIEQSDYEVNFLPQKRKLLSSHPRLQSTHPFLLTSRTWFPQLNTWNNCQQVVFNMWQTEGILAVAAFKSRVTFIMDCAVSALLPMTLLQCDSEKWESIQKWFTWLLLKLTATFTSYDGDKSGFKLLDSFLQAVPYQCPCRKVPWHLESLEGNLGSSKCFVL